MALRRILTGLLPVLLPMTALAQDTLGHADSSAGLMRSNGRIFVVVAVMLTILAGLIIYLVRLDRKIGKLEKEKP